MRKPGLHSGPNNCRDSPTSKSLWNFEKVAGGFPLNNTVTTVYLNKSVRQSVILLQTTGCEFIVLFERCAPAFSGSTNPPRGHVHFPKTRPTATVHLSQHRSLPPRPPGSYLDGDGWIEGRQVALQTSAAVV